MRRSALRNSFVRDVIRVAWPSLRAILAIGALASIGCTRPSGATRALRLRGIPTCGKTGYARALVVRVERDRAFFDDRFAVEKELDVAPDGDVTLIVPRERMRVIARFGLCVATSLSTWDCVAPTWIASTDAKLAAHQDATIDVAETLRGLVPCADGSTAR